jgi:hypothetical protein
MTDEEIKNIKRLSGMTMKIYFIVFLTFIFVSHTYCQTSKNIHADNLKKQDLLKIDSLVRLLNRNYYCDIIYKPSKTIINTEGYLDFDVKDTVAMKQFSSEYFQANFLTVKLLFDLLTKYQFVGLRNTDFSSSTLVLIKKGVKRQKCYLIQPPKNNSLPELNDKNSIYKATVVAISDRIALIKIK